MRKVISKADAFRLNAFDAIRFVCRYSVLQAATFVRVCRSVQEFKIHQGLRSLSTFRNNIGFKFKAPETSVIRY